MRTSALLLICALVAPACLTAHAQAPLKVAVFKGGTGGKAVAQSLAGIAEIQATVVSALKTDELIGYDALYLGSCTLDHPDPIKAIRVFVGCGGGLVLSHAACGRFQPKTLYPAIAAKVSGYIESSNYRN